MINKMCNAECGKSFWNKQNENFRNKLQAKIILKKKRKIYSTNMHMKCIWFSYNKQLQIKAML